MPETYETASLAGVSAPGSSAFVVRPASGESRFWGCGSGCIRPITTVRSSHPPSRSRGAPCAFAFGIPPRAATTAPANSGAGSSLRARGRDGRGGGVHAANHGAAEREGHEAAGGQQPIGDCGVCVEKGFRDQDAVQARHEEVCEVRHQDHLQEAARGQAPVLGQGLPGQAAQDREGHLGGRSDQADHADRDRRLGLVGDHPTTVKGSGSTDVGTGVAGYQHRASANGGLSWSATATGASATVTTSGSMWVQFRARDKAGNLSAWAPVSRDAASSVLLDDTPPTLPVVAGGGTSWVHSAQVDVTASSSVDALSGPVGLRVSDLDQRRRLGRVDTGDGCRRHRRGQDARAVPRDRHPRQHQRAGANLGVDRSHRSERSDPHRRRGELVKRRLGQGHRLRLDRLQLGYLRVPSTRPRSTAGRPGRPPARARARRSRPRARRWCSSTRSTNPGSPQTGCSRRCGSIAARPGADALRRILRLAERRLGRGHGIRLDRLGFGSRRISVRDVHQRHDLVGASARARPPRSTGRGPDFVRFRSVDDVGNASTPWVQAPAMIDRTAPTDPVISGVPARLGQELVGDRTAASSDSRDRRIVTTSPSSRSTTARPGRRLWPAHR